MQTQQTPKTWEDVLRMPDDGNRYEFIGGRLYVTHAPVTRHQRISKRLQAALMRILEDAGRGEVFDAPFLVEFPGIGDRVQPDLIFVSDERREMIGEKQVLGAVDPDEDVVDVWRFGNEPGHERFSGEFFLRAARSRAAGADRPRSGLLPPPGRVGAG